MIHKKSSLKRTSIQRDKELSAQNEKVLFRRKKNDCEKKRESIFYVFTVLRIFDVQKLINLKVHSCPFFNYIRRKLFQLKL